jgi:large exoprotein involved in heme utilization and adhesion
LFKSPDSLIDASSGLGVDGAVEIEAPDTDISAGMVALPTAFLDVASLLSERCSVRQAEDVSSFVVIGRDGIPLSPQSASLSSYAVGNITSHQGDHHFNSHYSPQIAKNLKMVDLGTPSVLDVTCPP